jgi:DNA primase
MTESSKLKALQRVLGAVAEVHGREHFFWCPWHAHHKPKLSVNVENDAWHCWVCDRGGLNLLRLLRFKGDTEESREYEKSLGPRQERKTRVFAKPELPSEFRTLTKSWSSPYYRHAMTYVLDRGLTEEDIWRYKIGYCEDGEYRNRVVFPSFDADGELNFVIGRSFYHQGKPYHHGEFDKDIVFNEYLVDWRKPVTLVEGVFDAISAGKNAIPRLGSSISESSKLFAKLLRAPDIYLAFDTDAKDKQHEIAATFLAYGKRPLLVDLGGAKDPGVMTKNDFKAAKSLARRVNSEFDLLRLKVVC